MKILSLFLVLIALASCTPSMNNDQAIDGSTQPIRELKKNYAPLPSAISRKDPKTSKVFLNTESLALVFGVEAAKEIGKQVNFDQEQVLWFGWMGSGQDKLSYTVLESYPEQIKFDLQRGLTKDLRTHSKIYVLRKNVTWDL